MPTPIQSVNSPIEISADGGSTWKVLICVASYTLQIQTQTSTTDTQCGRFIGLGPISFNPTVQAMCTYDKSSVQVTFIDCYMWQIAQTLLMFRVQSPANGGSYPLGSAYLLKGQCTVTDTTLTNQTNDPVKFSVTFSGQGTLQTS